METLKPEAIVGANDSQFMRLEVVSGGSWPFRRRRVLFALLPDSTNSSKT
jgi:hypothetical protein